MAKCDIDERGDNKTKMGPRIQRPAVEASLHAQLTPDRDHPLNGVSLFYPERHTGLVEPDEQRLDMSYWLVESMKAGTLQAVCTSDLFGGEELISVKCASQCPPGRRERGRIEL
ncbi:hypothetical protein EYF80_010104 [Liparis tanakae]|uniref:Uncharacterized protein n=1 Tax=Liparis tanakae TaxID=230148 RepID=A0A4Z2INY4_9TELE|nr:hypothetical protein EYF80_010104 [Liparis tanakae]